MAKQVKSSNSTLLIICSIFIIGITALFLRKIFFLEAQPVYASTEVYEIVTNKNPINIENILENQ